MRAILVLVLACAACYQPRFTSGQYKCDEPGDVCPTGFVCAAGRCVDPKDVQPALSAEPQDLRVSPTPDLSTPDLSTPDLSAPDLSGDLASPAGCTTLGALAGRDIQACKAAFASGNAPMACPATYRVCNKDDDNLLGLAAAGAACGNAGGFYAAQIIAAVKCNGDVQCESQTIMDGWALLGCGSEVSAADGTTVVTRTVGNDCKKAKVLLPCASNPKGWVCTVGLGDAAHTDATRGGVLCCKQP